MPGLPGRPPMPPEPPGGWSEADGRTDGHTSPRRRPPRPSSRGSDFRLRLPQSELDLEKGLEMRKWVLSGILASEETYLSHLEALLLVRGPWRPGGWGRGMGSCWPTWPGPEVSWREPGAPTLLGVIESPVGGSELLRGGGWQRKTGANPSCLHVFIFHGI